VLGLEQHNQMLLCQLKVRKTQEGGLICVSFFFFLTKSKVQLLIEFRTWSNVQS